MKKKLISTIMAVSIISSAFGFALPASANYGNETLTNDFENRTVGSEATGGAFAHWGETESSTSLVYDTNTETINPNGGKINVKYVQGTSDCKKNTLFWNVGNGDTASFGDCRITFDLYRTGTNYNFVLNQKSLDFSGGEAWNYNGVGEFINFDKNGNLNVFSSNKGTYEPGLYKIAVDYLRTQNKMVVTLLSGKINGEAKENFVLGEKTFSSSDSSAVSAIYFIQNGNNEVSSSASGMVDYIDNINRYAAENTWTSNAFTVVEGKNLVDAEPESISFSTPRFIDKNTMSNFKLLKNGEEVIGTTVSYAKSVDKYSYGCDPTFTFANKLESGEYTLKLSDVKDNYGQALSDISFTVKGIEAKCDITGVSGGLELDGNVIKNVLRFTEVEALLENIQTSIGAEAVVSADKFVVGGETVTVTSADKQNTKVYTIETNDIAYSYDFNNSKLASELASNEIPNAANRGENPGATLGKAFPNSKFAQFWSIGDNSDGTAQITGATVPEKEDRVGAISVIDYKNENTGNIRMLTTLISETDVSKHYAVNISVKPVKNELTKVYALRKDHNGSMISKVEFDDSSSFEIRVNDTKIKKYDINDWFDITYDCTYEGSKYIVKTFINGEYANTNETVITFEGGIGLGVEFYLPIKNETAETKSMYFDNISVYECAAMSNNSCPNLTYVPTESADDIWFNNKAGRVSVLSKTAAELVSALSVPSDVSVTVETEEGTVRDGKVVTGDKVVMRKGENIRTYSVDSGKWVKDDETKTVVYKFPTDISNGTWLMAVYNEDNSLKSVETVTEDGASQLVYRNDADNKYKVFLWESVDNMKPISDNTEFIG